MINNTPKRHWLENEKNALVSASYDPRNDSVEANIYVKVA